MGGAEFLRLDSIERDRANVQLLAVARFPNDDDQSPAERLSMYLRDELIE